MGLFDWLGRQVKAEAQPRARVVVADARNLSSQAKGLTAVAEQHYIRLMLSELFLKHGTQWFTDRFPLAYSLIGLNYAGKKLEFANVSGKNKFEIKQPDASNSILRNYALTPLLPFRGGDVELDCGLVSMSAGGVLQSFARVVSDLAGKLNAPQVASAVGIAESVAGGIQELLGAGKAETKLYFHEMLNGGSLRSGYIFLSGQKQSEVDPSGIWVTDDGVRFGPSPDRLSSPEPQNYLVLRLDVLDTRDDWRSLSAISEPLEAAMQAKFEGDDNKLKLLLGQAKLAAYKSQDLTRADVNRVIEGINKEFSGVSLAAASGATDGPPPPVIERAVARVSPEVAAGMPEPTEQAIYAGT